MATQLKVSVPTFRSKKLGQPQNRSEFPLILTSRGLALRKTELPTKFRKEWWDRHWREKQQELLLIS